VTEHSELTGRRRVLILAICCMSLLIVGLDVTIVNIALPSIGRELHASVTGLQWTVDAYTLVLGSFLILSGSTADRVGRKRVFMIGLATFTLGSLLCSLAPGLGWLVFFRTLQALGGSMLNPVALSIITNTFTEPADRARAIGVWGAVFGLSMALGPIVGGALVASVGWRGIFWVNIPVGVAAFLLTRYFVPESRAPHARRVDPVGQLLVVVVLASVIYAIIEGPDRGWGSADIVGLFALAAVAIVVLIRQESRRAEPLIDPRFFRSVPFSGATVVAVCTFAALGGFLLLNTLYLQDVRDFSPVHAGLDLLPMAAMACIFPPISGRIVSRHGPRIPLICSGVALIISGVLLTRLEPTTSLGALFLVYATFGIGSGLVNPPITNAAVSGMPRTQAGVAAAVASTSRQVGTSLGVAVMGSITLSALHGSVHSGLSDASHAAWWIVVGCGAAILALGLVVTSRWARATAARTAERLMTEEPRLPAPAK
jgi:EmrB/QacA subfamily drug resistance transporter